MKNTTTNSHRIIGATGHSKEAREINDFYATDPIAAEWLLKIENIKGKIWEPACGLKHLSNIFEKHGYEVRSSDLINRCGNEVYDFVDPVNIEKWNGNIITNPPYKYSLEFVKKSLQMITSSEFKICMFLKTQWLEGKERGIFFRKNPPKKIWVSSSRISCSKAELIKDNIFPGSCISYAWYIWEKDFNGKTELEWFN